jgi:Family of unknown function (DUF6011)
MSQRKRPAPPKSRPPRNSTSATKFIAPRRQDGYAAPDAEDRADTAILAAAEALGYRIAVQCLDCGHWLASPKSVAAHRGPVCRAKSGDRQ